MNESTLCNRILQSSWMPFDVDQISHSLWKLTEVTAWRKICQRLTLPWFGSAILYQEISNKKSNNQLDTNHNNGLLGLRGWHLSKQYKICDSKPLSTHFWG